MDILQKLTEELQVKKWQVEAAVNLIDEGNTIPFISRYRKEVTGALNDEQLRKLDERLAYLRNLEDKKAQVLSSIEEQGKLTDELRAQIEAAQTQVAVDDLYRPYRPKRRTRATMAKEKGLEGLANIILLQMTKNPLEEEAKAYLSEEKGVAAVEEALAGAKDIIAESISDEADYRTYIRTITLKEGMITSEAKDETKESVYENYYHFSQPLNKMMGHRTLALNRGEAEKMLTVKIEAPEEKILRYLEKQVVKRDNPHTSGALKETIQDSYHRLIAPAIEREIRNLLTEQAEELINRYTADFQRWLELSEQDEVIKTLNQSVDEIAEEHLKYLFQKIEVSERERTIISRTMQSALRKAVRNPIISLKTMEDAAKREHYSQVLHELFHG